MATGCEAFHLVGVVNPSSATGYVDELTNHKALPHRPFRAQRSTPCKNEKRVAASSTVSVFVKYQCAYEHDHFHPATFHWLENFWVNKVPIRLILQNFWLCFEKGPLFANSSNNSLRHWVRFVVQCSMLTSAWTQEIPPGELYMLAQLVTVLRGNFRVARILRRTWFVGVANESNPKCFTEPEDMMVNSVELLSVIAWITLKSKCPWNSVCPFAKFTQFATLESSADTCHTRASRQALLLIWTWDRTSTPGSNDVHGHLIALLVTLNQNWSSFLRKKSENNNILWVVLPGRSRRGWQVSDNPKTVVAVWRQRVIFDSLSKTKLSFSCGQNDLDVRFAHASMT